jgi:hypothetical protein
MDNDHLARVLKDAAGRRFWLKPVGLGDRPIILNGREHEEFGEAEVEIRFTRNADEVRDGDVLLAYRVGTAALMYVAERLPRGEWTTAEEVHPAGVCDRYPEWFKARNLTPEFGTHWRRFPIKPFTLAKSANAEHSMDQARLGRLNYRDDRAPIPFWFAESLIRRIQAASLQPDSAGEGRTTMTDIEKARRLFLEAGLAFPTIPEGLAVQLKEQGRWLFSTRKIDDSPYNLQHYVHEVDGTDVEDYAVLSHSGHGVNSYAIQYYLVYGPLRMFLHLGWGGVYMDGDAAAGNIRQCFSLADQIVPAAMTAGRLGAGDRLTVVGSDFYGSYWLVPEQSRLIESRDSKGPAQILGEVLHWLTRPR